MVNARVKSNLVHDCDTCFLGGMVELCHRWRDIAGGDDMLPLTNGRLDHSHMVGVRDEADHQVMQLHLRVQLRCVRDIQSKRRDIREAISKLLGALQTPAGWTISF